MIIGCTDLSNRVQQPCLAPILRFQVELLHLQLILEMPTRVDLLTRTLDQPNDLGFVGSVVSLGIPGLTVRSRRLRLKIFQVTRLGIEAMAVSHLLYSQYIVVARVPTG